MRYAIQAPKRTSVAATPAILLVILAVCFPTCAESMRTLNSIATTLSTVDSEIVQAVMDLTTGAGQSSLLSDFLPSRLHSLRVSASASNASLLPTADRIVGGVNALQNRFTYVASLRYPDGQLFCGGSLVHPSLVISAAHCLVDMTTVAVPVYVGEYLTNPTPGTYQSRVCKTIVIHPNYNPNTLQNDISLCFLDSPVTNYTPVPVAKPADETAITLATPLTVIGFGTISEGAQKLAKNLRSVTVFEQSLKSCNTSYDGFITNDMICAGLPAGGADSCQGDSGGPLIRQSRAMPGNASGDLLIGIVSFGYGCARAGYPGVYTNAGSFRAFINQQMQSVLGVTLDSPVKGSSPSPPPPSPPPPSPKPPSPPKKSKKPKPVKPATSSAVTAMSGHP